MSARDRSRPILVFGVVLYVTRVIASGWRTGFPSFFPDSSTYIEVSRLGPFDTSFWSAARPVGVPFALWLTGGNHRLFFLLQTILFAVSVAYLCSVVLKVITPRWLGWITSAVIASLCVHPRFGLWHLEILSESLSFSLSILAIALWLQFANDPTKRHLVYGITATVFWMSFRDVHIVTGIVIAFALLFGGLANRTWSLRKSALVGSAIIAIFSSYVLIAQGASNRNLSPLVNNIGERVLPNDELLETFAARKMPINDALLERTGDNTWSDDQAFLRSAELTQFRAWADEHGQRALLTSLVVDASFWIDTTGDVLHASLPLDFSEYDRHSTSEHLPTRLFWVQGPRTSAQLALWSLVAVASLAVVFGTSRRRKLADETVRNVRKRSGMIAVVGLIATAADLFVSASGDSVEVQRHVLGSILRLSLLVIVCSSMGASSVIRPIQNRLQLSRPRLENIRSKASESVSGSIAGSLIAVGTFGTWIALEHRSQDFDPQYARTIIERAARFGGTYYENGIHNKGPLETVVYDSVRLFTNFDTYWFGISAYVIAVSVLLGLTAGLIAKTFCASRRFAMTSAVLVAAHFSLSESDYAGVLYSRNITTALLALVAAATLWDRPWRTPRLANTTYLTLVVLLGLAVQTLLTTVFAATVVGVFLHLRRSTATTLRRPFTVALVTGATTIASAPAWYAIRGSSSEFWSNWWTYAGYMSSSTGRSLLNQIGLGAEKLFGYYQDRPGIALLIIVDVWLVARGWRAMSTHGRTVHTMLLAWLCAGWVELVLSQRYSSHYFSVVAVPTAFIGVSAALLLVQGLRRADDRIDDRIESKRRSWWASIACVTALIAAQGTQLTWIAVEGAGRFRNTQQYVQARNDVRNGNYWTHKAVMDLVSSDDDPLLAWTMYPWTYLDHRRVPATRFSWKSFMIGEIYLGRTSSEYVLDRTWEWFEQDMKESQPAVFARPQVTDLEPTTPLSELVTEEFSTVFTDDDIEIAWRNELWNTATRSSLTGETIDLAELPPSWSRNPSGDTISAKGTDDAENVNSRSDDVTWDMDLSCRKMTTRIIRTSPADPMGLTFRFDSPDETTRAVSLSVDFDRSWSARHDDSIVDSPVEMDATVLDASNRTSLGVTLLVTKSAAAIIVDGRIVSAMTLGHGTRVSISPTVDETEFTIPLLQDLDGFVGC